MPSFESLPELEMCDEEEADPAIAGGGGHGPPLLASPARRITLPRSPTAAALLAAAGVAAVALAVLGGGVYGAARGPTPGSPGAAWGAPGRPQVLEEANDEEDSALGEDLQYARVDGDIETIWQKPRGTPKAVFFMAHGCQHQGTDMFADSPACSKSNFGRCLNLPEEAHLRRRALARNYLVMAVSGGMGKKSCWFQRDLERVKKAVRHVKEVEDLPEDLPVVAVGASSGGEMVGILATDQGLPHLQCIVPEVSSVAELTWGNSAARKIPTLFVVMPRDGYTFDMVTDDYLALRSLKIRTAMIEVKPRRVTASYLERCLSSDLAQTAVEALRKAEALNEDGSLNGDPLERLWVEPVRKVIHGKVNDTLVKDESCIFERMTASFAFHEFTGQYAEDMLDFCEEKGKYAKGSHANETE